MDLIYNVAFGALRSITGSRLYRTDDNVILRISGIANLPEYFEAHFANRETGTATSQMGHDGDVVIPNALLQTGLPIFVWLYITNEDTSRTMYRIKIPVSQKAAPSGTVPSEQEDVITQAINALNTSAQAAAESASDASDYAESAQESASSAASSEENARMYATQASEDATSAAENAVVASQSATSASASASAAAVSADRAEQAASTAGYMHFEMVDGRLVYVRTDAVDVDFEIVGGHLLEVI